MRLTKAIVERLTLPPGASDKIWFDDELPGFGLRLRQGGKARGQAQLGCAIPHRRETAPRHHRDGQDDLP